MKFGTDEFYQYIKQHIGDGDYDSFYGEVESVVGSDARAILYKKGYASSANITKEDIEDIIQETQLSVLKDLVSFIRNSGAKSASQRNAWFSTIVDRRVKDFLRKHYRNAARNSLSFDDENVNIEVQDVIDLENDYIAENDTEAGIAICNTLRHVCDIRTSPEKIVAFLFSKFIGSVHESKRSNGSPAEVAAMLNGQTVGYAAKLVKQKICNALRCEISDEVFAALDDKLNAVEDGLRVAEREFYLSPRTITDSSNWIATKLKKDKDEILMGGKQK
jgi:hypothetical protein